MRSLLCLAWLLMLLGCAAQRPGLTSSRAAPGVDTVYVRVAGLPDVELISPDGKRIRTHRGTVLQQDLGVRASVLPVPPNVQIALLSPRNGTWQLHVQATEDGALWVVVERPFLMRDGKRGCDVMDVLSVKEKDAWSWELTWSPPSQRDTCWIHLVRAK